MNTGVVSVRYARALLKASIEARQETQILEEMIMLQKNLCDIPELRQIIDNPMVPSSQKADLLQSACGKKISMLTQNFISLVFNEGREKEFMSIVKSYNKLYRQSKNMVDARLITAVPVKKETKDKLRAKIMEKTSGTVEFKADISHEIIGGFILEYDTYRMDASIKKKLDSIRTQLKK